MVAAIVDAGPLVALLDRADGLHKWAVEQLSALEAPLLVCEPVLAEAMYLLRGLPRAQAGVFNFLESGAIKIAFRLDEHVAVLRKLHQKYQDVPMSLADACIVRMAERNDRYAVFTADSDFALYRKHGRTPITLVHPMTQR